MSSITGLISGGGGGTPVNSIARLFVGGQTQYTDESGGVWLKTGNLIDADAATYPNAIEQEIYLYSQGKENWNNSPDPFAMRFSEDGTIFTSFYAGWIFVQMILSTPYDLVTAGNRSQKATFSEYTTSGTGLSFWSNGSSHYAFVYARQEASMIRFTLPAAYDVSSILGASYASFNYASNAARYMGISDDGTKAYFWADAGTIDTFDLTTPYNLHSRVLASITSFTFSTVTTGTLQVISSNKLITYDSTNSVFKVYVMQTPKDVSSIVFSHDFSSDPITASGGVYTLTGALTNNDQYFFPIAASDLWRYDLEQKMGLETNTGTYDYLKLK